VTTKHPAPILPGTSRLGSYVYVIQFNSGTVKVGRTSKPVARLKSVAQAGRPHGITVAAQWLSQPHTLAKQNESRLIDFCNARFAPLNDGEFFADATVEDVVAFAETLLANPTERLRLTRFGRQAGRGGSWPETDPVILMPLSVALLAQIDSARGGTSRAQWLQEAAQRHLNQVASVDNAGESVAS
jgi:hypothetical protein